jgi:prepilin-type N-terminal cleavage/methylation domain-containing protein
MKTNNRGFSLIELLVALSILAVVSAIIVPKFLNVRTSASQTTAFANMKEINNEIREWIALGGQIGTKPVAGDVLNFLGGNGGVRATATSAGTALGSAADSSGTMGSFTIAISPAPFDNSKSANQAASGAITAAKPATWPNTPGFYVTGVSSGSTAYYCDGNGSMWVITLAQDATGNMIATVDSSSATGAVSYTTGQL